MSILLCIVVKPVVDFLPARLLLALDWLRGRGYVCGLRLKIVFTASLQNDFTSCRITTRLVATYYIAVAH